MLHFQKELFRNKNAQTDKTNANNNEFHQIYFHITIPIIQNSWFASFPAQIITQVMQILIRMNVIYDVDAQAEHCEKADKFFK